MIKKLTIILLFLMVNILCLAIVYAESLSLKQIKDRIIQNESDCASIQMEFTVQKNIFNSNSSNTSSIDTVEWIRTNNKEYIKYLRSGHQIIYSFDGNNTYTEYSDLMNGKVEGFIEIGKRNYRNSFIRIQHCNDTLIPDISSRTLFGLNLSLYGYKQITSYKDIYKDNPLVGFNNIYVLRLQSRPENNKTGCFIFEAIPADPGRFGKAILRIDPQHGYNITTKEIYDPKGKLILRITVNKYGLFNESVLIPLETEIENSYNTLQENYKINVLSAEVNKNILDSQFILDYSSETRVIVETVN